MGPLSPQVWLEADSGLEAVLWVDSVTLGPAVGGTRTASYASLGAALADAEALAAAMTTKCALAGLDAGGAKIVVLEKPGFDRHAVFDRLGELVAELGGWVHTGADYGTRQEDIATMARHSTYVHGADDNLISAAGRGILRCIEACARFKGRDVRGLSVAVQGAGLIGGAAARALVDAGADVVIADLDRALAESVASELGATRCDPESIFTLDVDVLCPCALGGVVTEDVVDSIRAWALCGGANNIVVDESADRALVDRGIVHAPDVVASAGAVTYGVGTSIMGTRDPFALVDALGETAFEIINESMASRIPSGNVARRRAAERLRLAVQS